MIDTADYRRLSSLRNPSGKAAEFDSIADRYHHLFEDWEDLVSHQARLLGPIMEEIAGGGRLRIIDPMCGIGTHCLGLERRGHYVLGTDISPKMIEVAIRHNRRLHQNVHFAVADLLSADCRDTAPYDAAVCLGNSITGFPDTAALRRALAAIRRRLRRGAPLIVGLRDYVRMLAEHRTGDGPIHFLNSDPPRTIHQTWELLCDGNGLYYVSVYIDYYDEAFPPTWRFDVLWRAVQPEELTSALTWAGFTDLVWCNGGSSTEHSVYQVGLDELLIVATAA